ncbi:hypothetical protein D9M71_571410 [compost metagenome]
MQRNLVPNQNALNVFGLINVPLESLCDGCKIRLGSGHLWFFAITIHSCQIAGEARELVVALNLPIYLSIDWLEVFHDVDAKRRARCNGLLDSFLKA